MLFLLLLAGLIPAEELFLSRLHRPKAGKHLVDEESLSYSNVSGVQDISTDQSILLFGRKLKTEDGLSEIVGGIDYVQLSLA